METRRFSIVLPAVQVAFTAVLTFWADRVDWILLGDSNRVPGPYVHIHLLVVSLRVVWFGVNAPTFPFCSAGYGDPQIAGFSLGELQYFAAVAILWFIVGRAIDRRQTSPALQLGRSGLRDALLSIIRAAWGLFLLSIVLLNVWDAVGRSRTGNWILRREALVNWILFTLWAFILMGFSSRKLVLKLRARRTGILPSTT